MPTALITAASAGLGAAAAKLFAQRGYQVVINYASNSARADAVVDAMRALSPLPISEQKFTAIRADLASREEIGRLVAETMEFFGAASLSDESESKEQKPETQTQRLDVVFSNVGWTHVRKIRDLDDNLVEEDWDRCFNVNVKSHLWLMHAARPFLEEAEGAFVTTASLAGVKSSGSSLAYSVSKAAQIHLVKGLALAAPKIRVNTVSPGLLLTDWGLQFGEEVIERTRKNTPLQRLPTVEDCAEQVWAFAQNKSMTGVNVLIEGGVALV